MPPTEAQKIGIMRWLTMMEARAKEIGDDETVKYYQDKIAGYKGADPVSTGCV